eukprot:43128_1
MGDMNNYTEFIVIHPPIGINYVEYQLDAQYDLFTAVIGIERTGVDAWVWQNAHRFNIKFYLDGILAYTSQSFTTNIQYENVELNVSGVNVFRIESDSEGTNFCDHATIATPTLRCISTNKSLSPLPVTRYGSTCEFYSKYLFVFGGSNATFWFFDTVYRYDIIHNVWTELPPMNIYGIINARTVLSHQLNLFYIATSSNYNPYATVWQYDPNTNGLTNIGDMSVARHSGMVEILNGIIYVFGGRWEFTYEAIGDKYPLFPTHAPTVTPTNSPSFSPSNPPSITPSFSPSNPPSITPSNAPTKYPSSAPSLQPSYSPTNSPSQPPTNSPSYAPSVSPSLFPSQPPSVAPSIAPSFSPTACVDFYPNYNSNDGSSDANVTDIANNVSFMYKATDSMVIDGSETAAFTTDAINLNDTKTEIFCGGIVACFQSDITCLTTKNDSFCNILCNGYLSCSEANIYANNVENLHIICNGEEACKSTQIYTENVHSVVIIDCVSSKTCDSVYISLSSNTENLVTCYLQNSCDNAEIYTTDFMDTTLKLYSYSNNIAFDNGFG